LNPPFDTAFPLEYSFHSLGDVRGKKVMDLGCGSGEQVIALLHRGAKVVGLDLSPDLIAIAQRRLQMEGLEAEVRVGSAYETGVPDASVDVVFCMSLIHHLDLPKVKAEMLRVLGPGGFVVLKEPIRFNRSYEFVRSFFPNQEDVSDDEHPLTKDEFRAFQKEFQCDGLRFFRLPWVGVVERITPSATNFAFRASNLIMANFSFLSRFATVAVIRLRKPA
jgi:ubiquinone/menaquinone biosynthesis C-methylase UbiE